MNKNERKEILKKLLCSFSKSFVKYLIVQKNRVHIKQIPPINILIESSRIQFTKTLQTIFLNRKVVNY